MADLSGCNLRTWCVLVGLGWGSAVACADSTDVTYQVNGNTADPAASPGDGLLTGTPMLDRPMPGSPPGDSTPGAVSPPSPQAGGAGAPPPLPQENPPPVQGPPAASGGEPQPSATETNFFGAGCRSDADCGENRRCEFPVDSEVDAAASPAPGSAGSPDAGADAAVPETLVPRGHCVAR